MKKIFILLASSFIWGNMYAQANEKEYNLPYKNTYVKQALVAENEFRNTPPQSIEPKSFAEAQKILPNPIWDGHSEEIAMYWKAWQIAIRNIRMPQEGSGFVSSYFDTAYNGNIFMWDSSFMMMFAKYGTYFFPFQQTLDNFYAKQHPDGFICREIMPSGYDSFHRYDPVSTGPNLMPWAEISYFRQFGDIERLHKIFPVLTAYNKWLKLNHTWQNGTYWSSGWGTGMDNTPRVKSEYSNIFSHGHMSWLDTNLQQIFISQILLEIGFHIERWQEIEEFEDEAILLKKFVSEKMWDEKTGFLYDVYADGSKADAMSIGAYWVLFTNALNKQQLDRMVAQLNNTKTFKRPHRIPSLAANHTKYKADGRYWQGGVWAPTNYMVVKGLMHNGYRNLAHEIALNDYYQIFDIYKKTGTFFEYYTPESTQPGFMARKDFVGWTGLAPIAGLFEFIFGINADITKNEIVWDMTLLESHGIERYPFGFDNPITLKTESRKTTGQEPTITVKTKKPFVLKVLYGKDKTKEINVLEGKHQY